MGYKDGCHSWKAFSFNPLLYLFIYLFPDMNHFPTLTLTIQANFFYLQIIIFIPFWQTNVLTYLFIWWLRAAKYPLMTL